MREALKDRVGRRGEFTAQFKRRGVAASGWGIKVTMLFIDVRDEAGTVVADHIWFKMGKQMDELKLEPGDRIRFMATVDTYQKRNKDDAWDDDEPRHVTDFRLVHPSNVRRMGASRGPRAASDQAELGFSGQ
jgi:hypothetical protein